ncbi:unnamed protein product [Tilletia caries]|nr:hypothetical protein CF335_g947 [Tilletia laevis]CAD6944177.1 unnamed protein product [Tilletia caries]CAD6954881.1 unnamed protein product [Tilletia caries]CAD7069018.1 unnamed protein product [Tilletia caries]
MRMEQWAALAPLTTQERDSVSGLASALSEANAAFFSHASHSLESQGDDVAQQKQQQSAVLPTSTSPGQRATQAQPSPGPSSAILSTNDDAKPTKAPQESTTALQASQAEAIEALSKFQRTLDEEVLNEHVLRANVNLAELRAGARSVENEPIGAV